MTPTAHVKLFIRIKSTQRRSTQGMVNVFPRRQPWPNGRVTGVRVRSYNAKRTEKQNKYKSEVTSCTRHGKNRGRRKMCTRVIQRRTEGIVFT